MKLAEKTITLNCTVIHEDGSLWWGVAGDPYQINKLSDGSIEGITDECKERIKLLDANNPLEVSNRLLDSRLNAYAALSPIVSFQGGLRSILIINRSTQPPYSTEMHLNRMLYANIITVLETFLADYLIDKVKQDQELLAKVVLNADIFKGDKHNLRDLIKNKSNPADIAIEKLQSQTYHNMKTVADLYKAAFGVGLPAPELISKAVHNRNDIVHRNGIPIDKEEATEYTKEQILELSKLVQGFVIELMESIEAKS